MEIWDTVYDFGAIEIIEAPMPGGIDLGPTWLNNSMFLAVYAPSQPVMRVVVNTPGNSSEEPEALTMYKDPNNTLKVRCISTTINYTIYHT